MLHALPILDDTQSITQTKHSLPLMTVNGNPLVTMNSHEVKLNILPLSYPTNCMSSSRGSGLCYAKRSQMSWVVVIHFSFGGGEGKVGVIPKEGRAWPRAPVLLLVWQRLRTLGTFLRNAAQVCRSSYTKLSDFTVKQCVVLIEILPILYIS